MKTITRGLAPQHPGVHLAQEMQFLELEKGTTAQALGISRQYLNRILNGNARITPPVAVHLAKAFSTTARLWLHLQMDYDLWHYRAEHAEKVEKIRQFA